MLLSGARIVIECLVEQGVDTVFGYPGGTIINVYDELDRHRDRIRHILTAHEQGAAHAADGYARATGRPGVVLATSGPGATNLVTGIAAAYMDSIPLVAITCNVSSTLIGRDSFQELSITDITMPITKHNFLVRRCADLAETIRDAFAIATSGRPGPVLVDIPKDLTAETCQWEAMGTAVAPGRRYREVPAVPSEEELDAAARLVARAERPLLLGGGGLISAGASGEFAELAELLDAPVALTLMGLGAIPSRHPRCSGMIGMHGTRASNRAACEADLILAAGARFSDRVLCKASSFAPQARIVQIDIDAAEVGKNIRVDLGLVGDLKSVLGRLNSRIASPSETSATRAERGRWFELIMALRRETDSAALRDPESGLKPGPIMDAIHQRVGDEAIIVTEVGQHQLWTALHYPFTRPRSFISSGGLGAMGFGTGASIGAQIGNPGRPVIVIAGDGSFRMSSGELATIAFYRLPILIIVMNNGVLGMVRQWQTLFYEGRHASTTLDRPPDFVKLAEAYSIAATRVADLPSLRRALDIACAAPAPALIEATLDPDLPVLPMVPPGRGIDEQIFAAP